MLQQSIKAAVFYPTVDRQRMISTPDKPTRVFTSDVSLAWHYYTPTHLQLVEVVFGHWKSTGIIVDPTLVVVNGSTGIPIVRSGDDSKVSWAGNLTNSLAVFVLYNVQPADGNVEFAV